MFMIWIGAVTAGLLVGGAVYFVWQKRNQKNEQKEQMRISVTELRDRIDRRDPLVIIDLRHPLDVLAAPQIIPGAVPVKPDEADTHLASFKRDAEIVLYCTCPDEETSLSVYRQLLQRGFQRVKVLTGGLPAWRREKLALQDLYPELEQQLRNRVAARV